MKGVGSAHNTVLLGVQGESEELAKLDAGDFTLEEVAAKLPENEPRYGARISIVCFPRCVLFDCLIYPFVDIFCMPSRPKTGKQLTCLSVSYTHLTLPTKA